MHGIVTLTSDDRREANAGLRNWRSYHLFYNSDLNLLLRALARPLLAELMGAGLIDRFYFIRYSMGGPHIRLRWRLTDDTAERQAEQRLAPRAIEFFRTHPSLTPFDEQRIRAVNRSIKSADPTEPADPDYVYATDSWRRFAPVFETSRYGGDALFLDSLSLFCLSSSWVLQNQTGTSNDRRAWARGVWLQTAAVAAWSLMPARDTFLAALEDSGTQVPGALAACLRAGDRFFDARREILTGAILSALRQIGRGSAAALDRGYLILGSKLASLDVPRRNTLWSSHMHMFANRLGIENQEELYLRRILWRTIEEVQVRQSESWNSLWSIERTPIRESMDQFLEAHLASCEEYTPQAVPA